MRKAFVLALLLASAVASAQQAHAPYPKHFNVCSTPTDCIVVTPRDDGWVGMIDGGTKIAWNFTIDDFTVKGLQMTGVSTDKDAEGRNQTVVIKAKPQLGSITAADGKARYSVGKKSTSRKVTVTWPSTFKIPNGARL